MPRCQDRALADRRVATETSYNLNPVKTAVLYNLIKIINFFFFLVAKPLLCGLQFYIKFEGL